jgi:hypothetical protein
MKAAKIPDRRLCVIFMSAEIRQTSRAVPQRKCEFANLFRGALYERAKFLRAFKRCALMHRRP